ncbi:MAG: acyltransferase [Oscillospiraceae bacterium]|nr:acyltransferase [Oscillospiraceae bacterium]
MKRVNYIDNLRWITVSLLVLFHTSVTYNTWGEANYIFLGEVKPFAGIVTFIYPWFMALMFLLAGVSSKFSLQKRGYKTFVGERFKRLGIPLLIGIVVISPILSYIADVTHNGYSGNFFKHYGVFFTKFTDLTGYDGGFTFAHLWFILALIVISLISLIDIKLTERFADENKKAGVILSIIVALIAIATFDVKFAGKPLIMYLCVYLLGYFTFSDQSFVAKLSRLKWVFTALFIIASSVNVILFIFIGGHEFLNNVCNYSSFVFGVLALICIGHDHLDFTNKFTQYNSKISYVFYIVHFPIVVLCQYALQSAGVGAALNFVLTILISYPITFGLCFVTKHFKDKLS